MLSYLYCWSIWAFSMRLSLARRFWNQILICVSVNCNRSANSNRLPREIYSFRWNSTSKRMVCSLLNVVRCRLGRPSFRLRRATMQISHDPMERKRETKTTFLLHMIRNDARKQLFFFNQSYSRNSFAIVHLFTFFRNLFRKYLHFHNSTESFQHNAIPTCREHKWCMSWCLYIVFVS